MEFPQAFETVLEFEGGYVNHSYDKGGETKYGITKARYPNEDIVNLHIDRARELYHRDFWNQFNIQQFPEKYRLLVFDMYVNHSPRAVGLIVQRAINSKAGKEIILEDGLVGNKTLSALHKYNPELFRILAFRCKYYGDIVRRNPDQMVFYVGWINRVLKISKLIHND